MLFRFAQPLFFVLLLALVPVLAWYVRALRHQEPAVRFSSLAIAGRLRASMRQRLRPALDVLRVLALLLLVVALARPSISRVAAAEPGQGIDIVLALDVSYSMAEKDLGPKSRLEVAKEVIHEFMLGRQHDRLGLVVFAAEAVTQSPLPLDYPVLLQLLDDVDHGRLPEGTAVGNGLATSVNLLRDSRAKSRVVVLLTDGQNNSGDVPPLTAAHMAELLNIPVYTIGIGAAPKAPPVRGPRASERFPQPPSSAIDEKTLRDISELTQGAYFRAVDQKTLKAIYDLIGQLETSEIGQQRYADIQDLSGYFLAVAAAFLIAEALLRNTWFRRIP